MTQQDETMTRDDPPGDGARPARRRLPAAVRIPQILNAALEMFSERGFADARMDDIAAQAGLSKGSLYLHFKSKEHLLEALLFHFLTPGHIEDWDRSGELVTPDLVMELVANRAYEQLISPPAVKAIRLLVAEGPRVSAVVSLWRRHLDETINPVLQRLIATGVAQGTIRAGALVEQPNLIFSPIVFVVMRQLVDTGNVPTPEEQARDRDHCFSIIRDMLTPP